MCLWCIGITSKIDDFRTLKPGASAVWRIPDLGTMLSRMAKVGTWSVRLHLHLTQGGYYVPLDGIGDGVRFVDAGGWTGYLVSNTISVKLVGPGGSNRID